MEFSFFLSYIHYVGVGRFYVFSTFFSRVIELQSRVFLLFRPKLFGDRNNKNKIKINPFDLCVAYIGPRANELGAFEFRNFLWQNVYYLFYYYYYYHFHETRCRKPTRAIVSVSRRAQCNITGAFFNKCLYARSV